MAIWLIKAGGQDSGARLDFHAWLLKIADSGSGDFQGYLQYAGGNFDARLWGHLNLLGGMLQWIWAAARAMRLSICISGPADPGTSTRETAGTADQRAVADTTANMYVMLSDAGLSIGGGEGINLDVGDDSVASAYVRGDVDIGIDSYSAAAYFRRFFGECLRRGMC